MRISFDTYCLVGTATYTGASQEGELHIFDFTLESCPDVHLLFLKNLTYLGFLYLFFFFIK